MVQKLVTNTHEVVHKAFQQPSWDIVARFSGAPLRFIYLKLERGIFVVGFFHLNCCLRHGVDSHIAGHPIQKTQEN